MVDLSTAVATPPAASQAAESRDPPPPRGGNGRIPRAPVRQGVMTVITPVEPDSGSVASLEKCLEELGGRKRGELDDLFGVVRSLHFLRWAVVKGDLSGGGGRCGPILVFSTNYDGSRQAHVEELVERMGDTLDDVYQHCADYPGRELLVEYLLRNHRSHAAFYNGALYRTRDRIEAEAGLFERIQEILERAQEILGRGRDWVGRDVRTVVQRSLRGAAAEDPELEELLSAPFPRPWLYLLQSRFGELKLRNAALAAAAVALFVVSGALFLLAGRSPLWAARAGLLVVVGLAGLAVASWRLLLASLARVEEEETERSRKGQDPGGDACPVQGAPTQELQLDEDHQLQNQLTLLNRVKRGRFRWALLRGVLFAVNVLSRFWFRPLERLGTLSTIHFAHWVLLPERGQLLFISNYDGPWSAYLDAFTAHGTIEGLNAIWTNTVGYPTTEGLLHGGPQDDRMRGWFKAWAREHQVCTQVWYSAYPYLSVRRINLHSRVHDGLFGRPRPERVREWLRDL